MPGHALFETGERMFPNPVSAHRVARLMNRLGTLAALLLLVWPVASWPCRCGPQSSRREDPLEAPFIFVGEVTTVERVAINPKSGLEAYRKVCLQPELNAWGVPPNAREVCVVTGRGHEDCGVSFRPGEEYLVYAGFKGDAPPGTDLPYTHICSGTTRLERRSPAVARSTIFSSLGFLLVGFGLGALALAVRRRKPAKV